MFSEVGNHSHHTCMQCIVVNPYQIYNMYAFLHIVHTQLMQREDDLFPMQILGSLLLFSFSSWCCCFFFLLSAVAVYTAAAAAEGFQSTFSFPIATAAAARAAAAMAYVVLDAAATVAGIVDGGR